MWRKHHTMFRHGLAQFLSVGAGFSMASIRIDGMPRESPLIVRRVPKRLFDEKMSPRSFPVIARGR